MPPNDEKPISVRLRPARDITAAFESTAERRSDNELASFRERGEPSLDLEDYGLEVDLSSAQLQGILKDRLQSVTQV